MNREEIALAVNEAAALDAECKAKYKRLSDIKRDLLNEATRRPDEHQSGKTGGTNWNFVTDEGARVTVTFPTAGIACLQGEEDAALREITGAAFGKLFEKRVTFSPVKSFREILSAVLPKPKAKKVLALVESPSTPKVAFGYSK